MFANQFHPRVIIADGEERHQDVLHLTDLLAGTDIKGGKLYSLSALTDKNRLIP